MVRITDITLGYELSYVGSNPAPPVYIALAQLGERYPYKVDVTGSSPVSGIRATLRIWNGGVTWSAHEV